MLGISPSAREQSLFSYAIHLEHRVPADHLLRKIDGALDLDFVIGMVIGFYGRSGHVSLDPRLIVRMMLLLFLYNIPSERELMDQIPMRLDFLWFLGMDLESKVPDHSVLSKARARWGSEVFEKLFTRTIEQCVQAGLVEGKLLHVDSTIVKANASKSSVVSTSPELVRALRQAYEEQTAKLEDLPNLSPVEVAPVETPSAPGPELSLTSELKVEAVAPESFPAKEALPVVSVPEPTSASNQRATTPEKTFDPTVLPAPEPAQGGDDGPKPKKGPVNENHISLTDPQAELARNKSGVTELNYKDHRLSIISTG
jgi:transposase